MEVDVGITKPISVPQSQSKRRRISMDGADTALLRQVLPEVENSLPTVRSSDYYKPCLSDLAIREFMDLGYCSRVQDFVVGRVGYGHVKFIGQTDVRCLDLIVSSSSIDVKFGIFLFSKNFFHDCFIANDNLCIGRL
ncbi:UNVERIFIED_CONTAM: Nuclear pore complex protein [Sesamum latifolium]|uniref:Nuclear pore complex protein n=1 Tax=Sesamum latifolium TaxID=2727402 RepID=A0AAW2Y8N0_9LAMI